MTQTNLVPIDPQEALDKYLTHRENEGVSDKTLESHEYRLSHFIKWCNQNDINSLSDLEVRDLQDFAHWRKIDGDLNNVSWHTQLVTFRVFIQWAENYQAVEPGFSERISIPSMKPQEDARDMTISKERAREIISYLEKYEYASRYHTLFTVLWHTGIRIGGARALDVQDFDPTEGYIQLKHRPETGTALKNGVNGERPIALGAQEVKLLNDYLDKARPDTTDSEGREPLFATKKGRAHRGTMRNWIYKYSRPCVYNGGNCPHDKDPKQCKAKQNVAKISKCPSSFSPHTIRRSSITSNLLDGVPKEAVSDRMNVNDEALEKHYDKRSEMSKMEQRKEYFT